MPVVELVQQQVKAKSALQTMAQLTSKTQAMQINQIKKRVEEGVASIQDLYHMMDFDSSEKGFNREEFARLANKLNVQLTEHKIDEIFTRVKGRGINKLGGGVLQESEFLQAMGDLHGFQIDNAIEYLGFTIPALISKATLYIILFILFVIFIWLGLESFAVGAAVGFATKTIVPFGVALVKEQKVPVSEEFKEINANIEELMANIRGLGVKEDADAGVE